MSGQEDTLEEIYPNLYPFIKIRRERKGGFVFNPYLYNEKWVDERGFTILTLCDGERTLNQIVASVAETYLLDELDARKLVDQSFLEFNNYFAINWRESPQPSKPQAQMKLRYPHSETNYYSAPLSVLWDITYRCNMKCPHCLIDYSKNPREMGLKEVEMVLEKLDRAGVFTINFSGGEPLLREDFPKIIEMASSHGFGLRISTNGLLLDTDTLDHFVENSLYCIQISVDGLEETHDSFRGLKGSYRKAMKALSISSGRGLHTTMSTMIIKPNLKEIPHLLELAATKGVSSFKLNSFMPVGRGSQARELSPTKKEIQNLARMLSEKREIYKDRTDIQIDAVFPWLLDEKFGWNQIRGAKAPQRLRCSAGQTTLVISPEGTTYPCPYLTDFPLGNILEESLESIWNNNTGILGRFRELYQRDLMGKCRDCVHTPSNCNGGCRAAAYNVTGDFYAEDPFCWRK
jgi:radical SAM protein with 4Fe4S-binding SPASM domain